jgi:DNA-binding IclR family transcriptional regulator
VVSEIGDTGFLTRRTGLDTVCVARQIGTYPIQVLAWDVGERRPLGVTNAGIAILSGMQADMLRSVSPLIDRGYLNMASRCRRSCRKWPMTSAHDAIGDASRHVAT